MSKAYIQDMHQRALLDRFYTDTSKAQLLRQMRQAKYKSPIAVANEQLASVQVSPDKIYAIDKAVRDRVAAGKYGADNSHVVCYETELANKPRTDRLNHLVYGSRLETSASETDPFSQVLYDRLQVTADEVGLKTAKRVRPRPSSAE